VAWRGLKRQKARSILTGLAVALGVANVFGVFSTNANIDRGLEQRTRYFAGADATAFPAHAQGVDAPLTTAESERVARLPGVEAIGLSWGSLPIDRPRRIKDNVYLLAINATRMHLTKGSALERGRLPRPGTDEVVLSESTARAMRLGIGDHVTARSSAFTRDRRKYDALRPTTVKIAKALGPRTRFRVVGIVRDPPQTADDPCCGSAVSLEYIWKRVGARISNEMDIYLTRETDAAQFVNAHQSDFPELHFDSPAITPEFRRFLQTLKGTLAGTSTLALFIGAFLIYLTFSMVVVERTRQFGTFHAIGAGARDVASAVLLEALVLGVISTVVGLVLGFGLAAGLVRMVTRIVSLDISRTPVVTTSAIVGAVAVGLVTTLVGAAIPAVRAARMSPVQAIRGADAVVARRSKTWITGLVLLVAGSAFATTTRIGSNLSTEIASVAVLIGAILVVPPTLGVIARVTRRIAGAFSPGLSTVSVMHITRERNRSSYTLALVMLILAAILTLATTNRSLHTVADAWLDKRFGADLYLYGPEITSKVERKIADVRGVAGVTSVDFGTRVAIVSPRRAVQNLVLIDPPSFFRIAGFPWSEGDDASSREAMDRGGSVLVPARLVQQIHVHRSDRIELDYAGMKKVFTIAGVYATLAEGPEIGVVGSRADTAFFKPDKFHDGIYINYARGTDPQTMQQRLRHVLAPDGKTTRQTSGIGTRTRPIGPYFAITGAEIKRNSSRDLEAYLRVFLAVVLIAAVVGVLGMANTLAASVLLRFREIGILQAVGAAPRAIRRMIVVESAILTFAAFVLSLGLGGILSWMFNKGAAEQVGFPVPFEFSWRTIPVLAVVAAVIAVVAAWAPARRAERLTPVEALRYE
jgi:ABC-type lipoprotein release transport system permease subunit